MIIKIQAKRLKGYNKIMKSSVKIILNAVENTKKKNNKRFAF